VVCYKLLKMPIIKTEFLEDRVKFHYHLSKPYGMPDDTGVIEILYINIDKLSKAVFEPYGWDGNEEIYIPNMNRTIIFSHGSHMERSMGPIEQDMNGPFLKE